MIHFFLHSGGNEESELCELQTAREWSDEEEEEGEGHPDDDEGLLSSPSIWGTPRQNSFELTFSYIAIAEPEAVGPSRHLRDRRRGGSRGSRAPLIHADTLETLLDSTDVDWDPQIFLSREEELERREQERMEVGTLTAAERREQHRETETITIQPSSHNMDPGTQGRDAGIQRQESLRSLTQISQLPSAALSSQHQSPSEILQAEKQEEGVKSLFFLYGGLSLFLGIVIFVIRFIEWWLWFSSCDSLCRGKMWASKYLQGFGFD